VFVRKNKVIWTQEICKVDINSSHVAYVWFIIFGKVILFNLFNNTCSKSRKAVAYSELYITVYHLLQLLSEWEIYLSFNDVVHYIIIINLLGFIFNILPIFVCRLEIRTYIRYLILYTVQHGFGLLGLLHLISNPSPMLISDLYMPYHNRYCTFSCYLRLTKPGVRYTYSSSYSDVGCFKVPFCKIRYVRQAWSALQNLYLQKQEFSIACCMCNTYTWWKTKQVHKRQTHLFVREDVT
jgi:hypothetical protein